ncbi:C_GCAxxG_C_C family protein [Desulfofarcimen acetoxidans DSM 771]|jgi:C_GCAxxG_C_C family probable redox protein|uniref:C_GCAxxG_C_C family protein n=1 Tax=Desulfofarcimen acetoxidans (strain ATCC 49208 / DSM 771 / KCTC 5769 / VKM B-1644 / 5575) TaxID=485916 RepID=C8W6Q0_DESAS|nr:DV_1555 family C-GCAxxG-C-C protein [Desulfofarcimen acetoxidans]ACV64159.1 C_GCAxxG_C_C family protein [Desulfofarcimen acetoxidans DSM 771]
MDDLLFRLLQLTHQGYCCSQILVILALETQEKNNADLVRSMAGLCNGIGSSGLTCGALSGGACVLALYAGKGADNERQDERFMLMTEELTEWFKEEIGQKYGGINCDQITGAGTGREPDLSRCGNIVADTYIKISQILAANDIDMSTGRNE